MYIIYYYHSNLFLQWNWVRLLSILWWKTSARWSGHYNGRLMTNCLQRNRATNSCLYSLWIAIERLGLTWNTRCLKWNSNSDTIHALSHSITRGITMKSHCWLLNIKKWKLWRLEKNGYLILIVLGAVDIFVSAPSVVSSNQIIAEPFPSQSYN